MDALVKDIKKAVAGDDYVKLVKKLSGDSSIKAMRKNMGQVETILAGDVINVVQHTFGYLAFLAAKAGTEFKNHNDYIEQARGLLIGGTEEALAMPEAQKLLALVTRKLVESLKVSDNKWARGVLPLREAVQKLENASPNTLTPVHTDFLLVCIKAKLYTVALPFVERPRFDFDPKVSGIEPLDFLTYYYYSGLVFIGLKQFPKALEAFQMALTIPTMALSSVQVESFKKYVIVCLLVHGQFIRLPDRTTSQVVLRSIDKLAVPYMEVATTFQRGRSEDLRRVIELHGETFVRDKTLGLVKQALTQLTRSSIQKLTKTYVTLALADLATQCGLPDSKAAENHLLNMIEDGAIFATINQKDGMISFTEDPEDYDTKEMVVKIDDKIQEVMALSGKLTEIERDLQLHPGYLTKTAPALLGARGGGAAERDGGGGGGGVTDDEMMKIAMDASLSHR